MSIKHIYINSPATTSRNPILRGNIFIGRSESILKNTESIKIAVAISQRKASREPEDWQKIIDTTVITKNNSSFLKAKDDYQKDGLVWVLETPIFEKTPVKVVIENSELLQCGFQIEIFARDALITREVPPNPTVSTGVTIRFEIGWQVLSYSSAATPVVEPLQIE